MEAVMKAIAGAAAGFIFTILGQQYGYYTSYKSNLDKLRIEVQKLTDARSDMQRKVEEARKRGEEVAAAVDKWLNSVEKSIDGANKLTGEDNEGHGEVQCLNWPFPNLCARLDLSKAAEEMAKEVSDIITEGRFLTVSFPVSSQMLVSPFARRYEALNSRMSKLDEIKQALMDSNTNIIGVYGMGGVGKTTLVEELAWQVHKEKSFDFVVKATNITNAPNTRKIQGQLADGLGLEFKKESNEGRAGELRERICKERSVLVILDDIWGELNLTDLGVPFGDDHKGCKLVLTSRDRNVLSRLMVTQKDVSLEVLSEKESWDLFQKMAGDVVNDHNIKPVAVRVAKCCGGLPLLIVTLAKAMRKEEDVQVWNDSLTILKSKSGYGNVIDTLKFSYDRLKSKELKSLFLLIGSLGNGRDSEELFTICWGLGIYENVSSLAQGRDRHFRLIKDLKASSLLLEDGSDWPMMHDLVRDMAKSVASTDQPTLVLERLPEKLEECPQLKVLLLKDYEGSVPEDFSGMTELNVLRLSWMGFTKSGLPPTLNHLIKLTSLNLAGCWLEDITIIGELKSLQILILKGVKCLVKIPKEIGKLTHLRMFKVSNCPELRFIARNVLSNLKCLEELLLLGAAGCLPCLVVEEGYIIASLGEIRNLDKLTTLELTIYLEDGMNFPRNLDILGKLKRYNIGIGCSPPIYASNSKTLKIVSSGASIFSIDGVHQLLKTVESLCLIESKLSSLMENREEIWGHELPIFGMLQEIRVQDCRKMENLFFISHARHLSQLHKLEIVVCESITEVIAVKKQEIEIVELPELHSMVLWDLPKLHSFCSMSSGPGALFDKVQMPKLEKMKLRKIKTCYKIWADNVITHSCMQNLTELEVSECDNLKSIFPLGVARGLVKLQTLRIESCLYVEHIFVQEDTSTSTGLVSLPNLETIRISNLGNLKTLWHNHLTPNSLCKLKQVLISECSNLLNIFPSCEFNNLKKLCIRNCGIESIFENNESDEIKNVYLENLVITGCHRMKSVVSFSAVFKSLSKIFISNCEGLVNIMTSSTATCLSELLYLEIANCGSMEEIVAIENDGDAPSVTTFMKLEHLELTNLPMLTSFYRVSKRNDLTTLTNSFAQQVGLPNLETLLISNLENLKSLWHNHLTPNSLCKLKEVNLRMFKFVEYISIL